jgi:Tol biopolymer transport system component
MRKAVSGGGVAETLSPAWGDPPRFPYVARFSRDVRYLVAGLQAGGATQADIWMLPLNAPGEKPRPYLQTNADERSPSLAPTSDWIAYQSDETRRFEIYVQSFPVHGRKYQVSVNGGEKPVWSRDGKELYFIGLDRQMIAVSIRSNDGSLEIGSPKPLFDSKIERSPGSTFDVSKDGRFLIPVQEQGSATPMTLVLNWQAGLKKN